MSRRKPTKPCATCGHGKGMHRVGCCRHQWTTRAQTFMGVGTVVLGGIAALWIQGGVR